MSAPTPNKDGVRHYGGFRATPERLDDCIESVPEGGRSVGLRQCRHKRGHGPDGLYCKIHDPERVSPAELKRRAKAKQSEKNRADAQKLCNRLGCGQPYFSWRLSEYDPAVVIHFADVEKLLNELKR